MDNFEGIIKPGTILYSKDGYTQTIIIRHWMVDYCIFYDLKTDGVDHDLMAIEMDEFFFPPSNDEKEDITLILKD